MLEMKSDRMTSLLKDTIFNIGLPQDQTFGWR